MHSAMPPTVLSRALAFDNSGKHLYVTNVFTNTITLFDFDAQRQAERARCGGEAGNANRHQIL